MALFAKWVKISRSIFLADRYHSLSANAEKSISSVLRDIHVATLEQALNHEYKWETILLAMGKHQDFSMLSRRY
ncbi:hypothetical protein GC197_05820 [bacterium]|nr:hypothetical protein [bacterium]